MLFALVLPTVNGLSDIRVGADSGTYWNYVGILRDGGPAANAIAFLSFTSNLVGPVIIGYVLQSPVSVAVFNLALLVVSLWAIGVVPRVDRLLFLCLLLLNVETAVSLVTLNKEILALTSMALIVRYTYQRKQSYWVLLISLFIGLLARWEQTAILMLFVFLYRRGSVTRSHIGACLIALVLSLTLLYPNLLRSSQIDLQSFQVQGEGGGGITILNVIQTHYGFALILPVKVLMVLFGNLVRPWYFLRDYLGENFSDLQNQVFINLHVIAMAVLWCYALSRKRFTVQSPLGALISLYLVVTAINPFVQPRYEYPVYFLLALELSRTSNGVVAGEPAVPSRMRTRFRFRLTFLPTS